MTRHYITREIGIDAGHRVTHHGSKCRNVHGHRYVIEAHVAGPLFTEGEQEGMVLDFAFLKEEMLAEIDAPCDHGMIMWRYDGLLTAMFSPTAADLDPQHISPVGWWGKVDAALARDGYAAMHGRSDVKVYIVPFVPTAENLAQHWYERLSRRVEHRTQGAATLLKVRVWETPNCSASYPYA